MNTGISINGNNGRDDMPVNALPQHTAAVRLMAKIISYIFHPVFVPVYIVLFMVFLHPYMFVGLSAGDRSRVVIMAILMFAFFPIITVLLLKALDFIQSVFLSTQKDRIIPLVACGIWYFWIWYVWRNQAGYPAAAVQLTLAVWISVSLALLANIIMKISLHTISMGVMLTFIINLAFTEPLNYGLYLAIALFITGLVCTARFIASDHTPKEIYGGLVLGIGSMLLAIVFG